MVAYKLKERTKHHGWQDGQLVKLNPGAIIKNVNPNFKDKFDLVDDVPDDRMVKLDRPVQLRPTKSIIKEAVGQKVITEPEPEDLPSEPEVKAPPAPKHEPLVVVEADRPEDENEVNSTEDDDDDDEDPRVLKSVWKRGSKWIVVDENGEKTHTGYYHKKESERIAAEG